MLKFRHLRLSPVMKRLPWTILILFVYLLGRRMPLATVPLNLETYADGLLENLAMVSGGTFSSLTLFSLGLSPYMTGMILWRFLAFFEPFKLMTVEKSNRGKLYLMLLVASIQAFGLTRTADFSLSPLIGDFSPLAIRLMTMGVMISGAFVLMWLGNINSLKGIGASMIIIVSNMILNFLTNLAIFLTSRHFTPWELVLSLSGIALGIGLLAFIAVVVYRAEYRIKMRRINIISDFAEETYLPIKLNPAGGLPFMYSMTLMILPPMLISSLLNFFPDNELLNNLSGNVGLSQLPGILIYISLLCFLSIGFSYYNYDPTDLADNMQINGDYIEHVRPGKETVAYIHRYLRYLIVFGTIFIVCMGGLPLLIRWSQNGQVTVSLLINNIYIVTTLMLGILEQVTTLQSWKKYKQLI